MHLLSFCEVDALAVRCLSEEDEEDRVIGESKDRTVIEKPNLSIDLDFRTFSSLECLMIRIRNTVTETADEVPLTGFPTMLAITLNLGNALAAATI